jgi:hypothetical protein
LPVLIEEPEPRDPVAEQGHRVAYEALQHLIERQGGGEALREVGKGDELIAPRPQRAGALGHLLLEPAHEIVVAADLEIGEAHRHTGEPEVEEAPARDEPG